MLKTVNAKKLYFEAYSEAQSVQNYLNSIHNYFMLKGMQSNMYKCFLPKAWNSANKNGIIAFLHPEGVYDDPKGGEFREYIYNRLVNNFQFQN